MVKIILDTDLGCDCDDVGAAAVLCSLAKAGEAEIVCAASCISNPWGARMLSYELASLGFPDVPVGALAEKDFMADDWCGRYARVYGENYHIPQPEFEDAVRVMRRALAENNGGRDITLAAIGPLRNIANLLRSEGDDISPKSGRELIAENVCEFVTMLGSVSRTDYCEWNVKCDIPSARYVISEMPVPTVFSPFELGDHIVTGNLLPTLPVGHVVREAYYIHEEEKKYTRFSWDPITVLCAVRKQNPLYERRPLHVSIKEDGCFDVTTGDDMFTLVQKVPDEEVVHVIDALMI